MTRKYFLITLTYVVFYSVSNAKDKRSEDYWIGLIAHIYFTKLGILYVIYRICSQLIAINDNFNYQ